MTVSCSTRMRRDRSWPRPMGVPLGLLSQSRVSKAQKTRGILNVFGVYDYTNNQIWTHSYKKKTGKQFLDFIKRVDQKYDDSIKQIFLVLDNVSIHKSNKVKQTYSQIPSKDTVSISSNEIARAQPDRGKVAVDAQTSNKQSTFQNERDIGKAVSDWTCDYNKKHAGKTSINSLHGESIYMFT